MTNLNAELIIKTKVWLKENIELIDYLNTETIDNLFQTKTSGVIRRENQDTSLYSGNNLPKTNNDLIKFERNPTTGKYIINCGSWSKNLEKLVDEPGIFMVYKGSVINDYHNIRNKYYYKLSQGDIIKLGRVYLKVLDICINKENIKEEKNQNKIKNKYRGTMLHSSSSNCMFINGQQIIKGAFSPRFDGKNKKLSQIIFNKNELNFSNSILTSRKQKLKNEDNSFNIDLFAKKKIVSLPRINSTNELFFFKKITHTKNKKIKSSSRDIFLEKPFIISKTKPACRICYGENNTDENPLIVPCTCKGSMKYIHYDCLKNWLNAKIEEELSDDSTEKNNMECISYNKNSICCELCKTKYPDYLIHNNIYYNILFYKPNYKEFIIFESMKVGKDKTKHYHVVTFDDRDFINIGRANECELSIAELSVSRFHCMIHKENGNIFLEDNTSKFGTLVLVQNKNMIMNEFTPLRLQVNKTFIKFKLEIPFSFSLNCCGRQNTFEGKKLDYHEQNKKGFDILSYFVIKNDNTVWGIDDDNNEEEKNNIDNNNNIKTNKVETNDKKDLIDNEENNKNMNIVGNTNNIININNLIEEEKNNIENNNINKINNKNNKDKESLIDKSNAEDIVEIESENKNELIDENNKIEKNDKNKNKEEINIVPKKRIKKISIKRDKNNHKVIQNLEDNIKDNYSMSLATDRNKKSNDKINIEEEKNNKQLNTMKEIKNDLNIFYPQVIEPYSEHNNIPTEKKEK